MYFYGYGNGGNNCCPPNYSYNPCCNPCGGGAATGAGLGGNISWIAVILVIFLLLVLCGFARGGNGCGGCM